MDATTTNTTATTATVTIDNACSGSDITSITYASGTGTLTNLNRNDCN